MGYAELIKTLESLPPERRAEVFDFAEFLAARCQPTADTPGSGPLAKFRANPIPLKGAFESMKRDELYDRACLR
jgi:hypothetical protein